jgi:ParB-like chromosome segregation protein Spo0J|tara:strand:- start:649 stop:1251 length:603 start_codon:yes stop_codon:yes gene_type:complete
MNIEMQVKIRPIEELKPFENNPRKNQKVGKIAQSIKEYGFTQPIVVDEDDNVIIGHTRLMASKELGLKKVPVVTQKLNDEQIKALRIADNRLNEDSEWDYFLLGDELKELLDLQFDLELTGFEKTELENLLDFETENDDLEFNDLTVEQDKYTKSIIFSYEDLEKYTEIVGLLNSYIDNNSSVSTNEEALERLLSTNRGM